MCKKLDYITGGKINKDPNFKTQIPNFKVAAPWGLRLGI